MAQSELEQWVADNLDNGSWSNRVISRTVKFGVELTSAIVAMIGIIALPALLFGIVVYTETISGPYIGLGSIVSIPGGGLSLALVFYKSELECNYGTEN